MRVNPQPFGVVAGFKPGCRPHGETILRVERGQDATPATQSYTVPLRVTGDPHNLRVRFPRRRAQVVMLWDDLGLGIPRNYQCQPFLHHHQRAVRKTPRRCYPGGAIMRLSG